MKLESVATVGKLIELLQTVPPDTVVVNNEVKEISVVIIEEGNDRAVVLG